MHLDRKRPCKLISNIDELDDVKKYILSGVSYQEYYEKFLQNKVPQNSTILPQNTTILPQNTTILPQNFTILPQNTTILPQNYTISPQNNDFCCMYCCKKFSRKDSLKRHLKKCKEKQKDDTVRESMTKLAKLLNDKDNELKSIILTKDKQLKEELDRRDKQIELLIEKSGLTTNNITTNNNIQNNFKLLNYKETDTSHLTENDYIKCLDHYNFCVPHIIRKIHFNPKKPENHNIYISNLKNSYVMIYMNNKWKVRNRDDTISEMIDDKQILLEKKIQEWVESGKQYPKIMAKFNRYIQKREHNDVINAIKEDIKLILYNNRNIIKENNKKIITNKNKI
jgi:hypothetical protein